MVSLNDNIAVVLILCLASSSLDTPGNWTLIKLVPSTVITGSDTPSVSILFTIASYVLLKSSLVSSLPSSSGNTLYNISNPPWRSIPYDILFIIGFTKNKPPT